MPFFLPAARMFSTYAVGLEREPGAAALELRTQLGQYLEAGARFFAPGMYGMYGRIAELELLAHNTRSVGTTIEEGLKLVEDGCDLYSAPYLYRLLGLFHARAEAPNLVEADRALRISIDVASAQSARSERLLSALELARMPNQSPDSLSDARNILVSVLSELESETEFPAVAEAKSLLVKIEDVLVSAPRGRA